MAAPAEAASTVAPPEVEKERGRGHIGLVVLGSIAGGLILGLVLVLVVFAGGREDVITGSALIALAFGMLMLFELARRRTDQPQSWALGPGLGIGLAGLALLILGPSDRVLGPWGSETVPASVCSVDYHPRPG
jgi:peptidoglycan/LPS O-acetylase OafA/YrhL